MPCILVAKKEQQELEQGFYQNVLGIESSFYFVESIDDARLAVIGNGGFLSIADVGNLPDMGKSIRRLTFENLNPPKPKSKCRKVTSVLSVWYLC